MPDGDLVQVLAGEEVHRDGLVSFETRDTPMVLTVQDETGHVWTVVGRKGPVDLYRLDQPQQAVEIGIEEELAPDGWTIIEWAEKLGDVLPANAVRIGIEIVGENERRITVWEMRNAECGVRNQKT